MIAIHILLFLIACISLVKSADVLVGALVKIAYFLNLSEFTVGFIIMAFATSVPELFVGISSAFNKIPALSLGNVIGANILYLTLISGLVIILAKGIKVEGQTVKGNTFYMLAIVIILLLLALDHDLSRADGCMLLLIYFVYIIKQFSERKKFKKTLEDDVISGIPVQFLLFCVGVVVLLISASFVVKFASLLSVELSLPLVLVGLVIVSLGTALPELTFEIKAVTSGHKGMALGDLLGSFVTNITLVLGIVALICPIIIEDFVLFLTSAIFLLVMVCVFGLFVRSKKELSFKEGMVLIMFYIGFIIIELIARSA